MKPTVSQIEAFLREVDDLFPVPLSRKQNLCDFAIKLHEKATICYAKNDGRISAMVAGYTDNLVGNIAYISIVATCIGYRGRGYASSLVKQFINICKNKNISAVHLYSAASNSAAIKMYQKIGFVNYRPEEEPRPDDTHLIFYIGK